MFCIQVCQATFNFNMSPFLYRRVYFLNFCGIHLSSRGQMWSPIKIALLAAMGTNCAKAATTSHRLITGSITADLVHDFMALLCFFSCANAGGNR